MIKAFNKRFLSFEVIKNFTQANGVGFSTESDSSTGATMTDDQAHSVKFLDNFGEVMPRG